MRLFSMAAAFALLAAPTLALAGPVDVNTADAETISAELKGVGLEWPRRSLNTGRSTDHSAVLMTCPWSRELASEPSN